MKRIKFKKKIIVIGWRIVRRESWNGSAIKIKKKNLNLTKKLNRKKNYKFYFFSTTFFSFKEPEIKLKSFLIFLVLLKLGIFTFT